jgi:hypothetical protein
MALPTPMALTPRALPTGPHGALRIAGIDCSALSLNTLPRIILVHQGAAIKSRQAGFAGNEGNIRNCDIVRFSVA